MMTEDSLRVALRREGDSHVIERRLPHHVARNARMLRGFYSACAAATAGGVLVLGATLIGTDSRVPPIHPAGEGAEASASVVASGTAPDGSTWKLSSFEDPSGFECFGFSTDGSGGSSETCHAVPPDRSTWLHIDAARLINRDNTDAGGALFGEVSKTVTQIVVRLDSGQVVTPELVSAPGRPYDYFIAFLEPNVTGVLTTYDNEGGAVYERRFILDGGLLGDQ